MQARAAEAPPAAPTPAPTVPAARGWGRSSKARRRLRSWGIQAASLVVFFAAWEIVGRNTNPVLFSTPDAVVAAFFDMLSKGQLQEGFVIAAEDLLTGYILAVIVGVGVGLLMGRNRILEQVLNPYINFMQATPLVAVVPLIVIWLGIGFSARVAVVFILALWSVIINTSTGVKTVPRWA